MLNPCARVRRTCTLRSSENSDVPYDHPRSPRDPHNRSDRSRFRHAFPSTRRCRAAGRELRRRCAAAPAMAAASSSNCHVEQLQTRRSGSSDRCSRPARRDATPSLGSSPRTQLPDHRARITPGQPNQSYLHPQARRRIRHEGARGRRSRSRMPLGEERHDVLAQAIIDLVRQMGHGRRASELSSGAPGARSTRAPSAGDVRRASHRVSSRDHDCSLHEGVRECSGMAALAGPASKRAAPAPDPGRMSAPSPSSRRPRSPCATSCHLRLPT